MSHRVLVVGASGFIGSHLVKQLAALGHQVWGTYCQNTFEVPQVKSLQLNLSSPETISDVLKQANPTHIYFLSAAKPRSTDLLHLKQAMEVNVFGSFQFFSEAQKLPELKQIIYVGTGEEYGQSEIPFKETNREQPISAYSLSKVCTTQIMQYLHRTGDLPVTIVRPSLAYGPGQSDDMFIPSLIRALKRDQTFPMSPGEQTRDFIYISDLVDAMVSCLENERTIGEILNLSSGVSIPLKSLAEQIQNKLKKNNLLQIGELPYRKLEIMNYTMDNSRARDLLNWSPKIPVEQGIDLTIGGLDQ